jgi:hypothetical protein
MKRRPRHLDDELLFDCYLTASRGERLDPPAADHLVDCPPCAARYANLLGFMRSVREQAELEADEVFTEERLRAQARAVTNRIGDAGRIARVINFPQRLVKRTVMTSGPHGAPRWIAAAAAAGLFVGVALGASLQGPWRSQWSPLPNPLVRPASGQDATRLDSFGTAGRAAAADLADDEFLFELERAVDRPHSRELLPFDALTPHVREIVDLR